MTHATVSRRHRALLLWWFLLAVLFAGLLTGGCTKTLDGEQRENQIPVVYFVNVPEEDETFGDNPIIYWFGSDADGLIKYYRYHLWVLPAGNTMDPLDYIETVSDDQWTYIDVDPTDADQKTQRSIRLAADSTNPGEAFVPQYVFIQAFDYDGAGSEVAYRRYSRNANPPTTEIYAINEGALPFVNAPAAGGVNTGVYLQWKGWDEVDHPTNPPPFEFEWRIYGPYGGPGEPTVEEVLDSFMIDVYLTTDGRRYRAGDSIPDIDTTFGPSPEVDTTWFIVDPDDKGFLDSVFGVDYGTVEEFLRFGDSDFVESEFDRVAARSSNGDPSRPGDEWVWDTSDTIYNIYRFYPDDSTIERDFLFWIRSRDDGYVPDLVPDFVTFPVVDPKKERDILVLDYTQGSPAVMIEDSIKPFWRSILWGWRPGLQYDDSTELSRGMYPDYIKVPTSNEIPLRALLQHKVLILFNDMHANSRAFDSKYNAVFKAIPSGINAWMLARGTIIGGNVGPSPNFFLNIPPDYTTYFGVTSQVFSGWSQWVYDLRPPDTLPVRVESFVGTYSIDESRWPTLEVDTALLRTRYEWMPPPAHYREDLGAIPEINWSSRAFGSEAMYLFRSRYGDRHPLGGHYNYEGAPCAHRFDRGAFRTVHMNFTLTAIKEHQARPLAYGILDWLMERHEQGMATSNDFYPDSPPEAKLDMAAARARYLQMCQEASSGD